jgi:hypothetical protein
VTHNHLELFPFCAYCTATALVAAKTLVPHNERGDRTKSDKPQGRNEIQTSIITGVKLAERRYPVSCKDHHTYTLRGAMDTWSGPEPAYRTRERSICLCATQ